MLSSSILDGDLNNTIVVLSDGCDTIKGYDFKALRGKKLVDIGFKI